MTGYHSLNDKINRSSPFTTVNLWVKVMMTDQPKCLNKQQNPWEYWIQNPEIRRGSREGKINRDDKKKKVLIPMSVCWRLTHKLSTETAWSPFSFNLDMETVWRLLYEDLGPAVQESQLHRQAVAGSVYENINISSSGNRWWNSERWEDAKGGKAWSSLAASKASLQHFPAVLCSHCSSECCRHCKRFE